MSKKPAGYWTYEHCLEEAKKCKSRTDFQHKSKIAYMTSLQNKWISEFTWLELKVKPRGFWNYDRCYEEAHKYKTKHEFEKNAKGAYNACLENGWMKEYTWLESRKKQNGYWTYENCYKESMKFNSRREFQLGSQFAYKIACQNKWIDEWFISVTGKKWEETTCLEESKNYKTRSEFERGSVGAYRVASMNGWIDSYSWLKDGRLELFKDKIDSVYAYEFLELNAVYVGRTLMRLQKNRDRQHIWTEDSVSKFAKINNIPVPKMKVLEENLTLEEGATKEGVYVMKYKNEGWTILNKAKTGGIGKIGKARWSKEECFEEAKKFTNYYEFRTCSPSAHRTAIKNGWIEDYTWLIRNKKPLGYWTKEKCFEEAQRYSTLKDFLENNETAYVISKRNKWLNNYTWLKRQVKPRGYWTKERCFQEALKYKTKKDLERGNGSVYQISRRNGWLKDYTWLNKI